ncbi:hypothetical protein MRX96_003696 [Rhipicephalus microplus]
MNDEDPMVRHRLARLRRHTCIPRSRGCFRSRAARWGVHRGHVEQNVLVVCSVFRSVRIVGVSHVTTAAAIQYRAADEAVL